MVDSDGVFWRSSSLGGCRIKSWSEFNFLASNNSSHSFWAHMAGQNFMIQEWKLTLLELERTGRTCPHIKAEHAHQALGFAGDWWTLRDKVLVERREEATPAGSSVQLLLPLWRPVWLAFFFPHTPWEIGCFFWPIVFIRGWSGDTF